MRKYLIAAATAAASLTTATGWPAEVRQPAPSQQPCRCPRSRRRKLRTRQLRHRAHFQYLQPVYDSLLRNDKNGEPTPTWLPTGATTPPDHAKHDPSQRYEFQRRHPARRSGCQDRPGAAKKGTGEAGRRLKDLNSVEWWTDPREARPQCSRSFLPPNLGGNAGYARPARRRLVRNA